MDEPKQFSYEELLQAYNKLKDEVNMSNPFLGQAILRKLIINSPLAMFLCDLNGNIRLTNKIAAAQTGYSIEKLETLSVIDLDADYSTVEMFANFWENTPFNISTVLHTRHITSDGKIIHVEINGIKLDLEGEVLILGIVQDVTEKTNLLNTLKDRNRFFEYAIDLFTISDFSGRFLTINPSWTRELGWSKDEFLEKPWLFFVHPEDVERTLVVFEDIKKGKKFFQFENRYLCKDGSYKWIAWNAYPYAEESIIYSVGRNITDQRELEQQYKQHLEMLNKLAEMVPGVVYQYQLFEDGRSCFPYSSPGMQAIYNCAPEDVITDATPVFNVLHPDDIERVSEDIFRSARELSIFHCEYRVVLPNKDSQWRLCDARPERMPDGSTLWYGIITDISDRKQKEEQIYLSEQKYKIVADNTYNWEFWEDETGKLVYVSPACLKVTGYSADEFIADKELVSKIILPEDLNNFSAHKTHVKSDHGPNSCSFRILTKTGEIKHIQHVCLPAYDSHGNYRGIRGTNLDVTESVLQINKIQSLLTIEEEHTKRMRSFTHIVSHNLRSHTANMSGLLSLLEEEHPEYYDNNYIKLLKQSSDNLNQTLVHLNQVLNINMIESAKWVEVNLLEYINKAINSVSTLARFSDLRIQVDVSNSIYLRTVPAYLESILLNLLTNGIKYSSPDRKSFLVIKASQDQNYTTIIYQDNGIGIDLMRYGADIFGMYKTFHGNKDSKGLGLFMTRNQIEAMGGKIEVESKVNVGTTFTITLPKTQSN